jgi:DNA-directed RNA polymerase specialized sigma24 family protein
MEWFEKNNHANELDAQLQSLVIQAQEHPLLSQERQQALNDLIKTVLRSQSLWYPSQSQFYQEVYDEAIQNLWLYVCQSVDKYDAKVGSVMAWLNMLLRRRFYREALVQYTNYYWRKANDLDQVFSQLIPVENSPLLSQRLQECIELDLSGIFQSEHIENHPKANFQELLKRRLSKQSWSDISKDLGIGVSTLSNFYQRCIKKYQQKFQDYLRH